MGKILKKLFQTSYFRIVVVPDEETVELCGALKVGSSYASGSPICYFTDTGLVLLSIKQVQVAFCQFPMMFHSFGHFRLCYR